MPPAGFEPTISAGEQSQTYALDRAATGIGLIFFENLHPTLHFKIYTNNFRVIIHTYVQRRHSVPIIKRIRDKV